MDEDLKFFFHGICNIAGQGINPVNGKYGKGRLNVGHPGSLSFMVWLGVKLRFRLFFRAVLWDSSLNMEKGLYQSSLMSLNSFVQVLIHF